MSYCIYFFMFVLLACCVQMNDYIAAYHDAVLLFGQVMREIWQIPVLDVNSVNINYFRNVSFKG